MKKRALTKLFLIIVFFLNATLCMSQIQMKGYVLSKIVDFKPYPIVGALVYVEGTDIATHTDSQGLFLLNIPKEYENRTVVAHCYGYLDMPLTVTKRVNEYVMQTRPHQRIPDQIIYVQNRPQREEDVPIAVTALTQSKIALLDISKEDNLARYVPGFFITMPDYANPQYGIRGIFSDNAESFSLPRAAVTLDGINISRMQASLIELFDLEQVEVAKGPQGTLSGSSAEGGSIKYYRRKPIKDSFDLSGYFKYGLYNQRMTEIVANTPISPVMSNRFAVRTSASDGWQKNVHGGRLNADNNFAVRDAFSIFISDRQTLTFSADYQTSKNTGSALKANKIGTSADPLDTSPFSSLDLDNEDIGLDRKIINGIMQYDFDISSSFKFSNTLGYRYYESDNITDLDGSYLPILNCRERSYGKLLSEEAKVNWTIWDEDPDDSDSRKLYVNAGLSFEMEDNTHEVLLNSNPHYLYPLAFGSQFRRYGAEMDSLISRGFLGKMDQISQQLQDYMPEQAEVIKETIESYKTEARRLITSSVNKVFDRIFSEETYWQTPPDIVSETVNECVQMLTNVINQIAQNDIFKPIVERGDFGNGIDDYVNSLNVKEMIPDPDGVFGYRKDSDMPDIWYEDMTDRAISTQASAFADFNWKFMPRLYLTLGARAAYERIQTSYFSGSKKNSFNFSNILFFSTDGKTVWAYHDNLSWMGHCILNWKFENRHNLYASFSKGTRPGTVFFNLAPNSKVTLDPEVLYNYEAGIKGISEYGYFKYYASIYYYDYHNVQRLQYGKRDDGSVGMLYSGDGKARGFGLDGSLKYTFSNNISIFMDYAYCNARFCRKDMNGNEQALSGKRIRLNPEHAFDIGLDYKHKFSKCQLLFCPSATATGRAYFDDANSKDMRQNAYAMVNFNLGIRVAAFWNKNYDLDFMIYGKNITNSKYIVGSGIYGSALGYPTFAADYPATFGLILRFGRHADDSNDIDDDSFYY